MFEIGPALREARERRGLAFGDVEADTAIRTRYIRALEEEQFDVLPGATYTKGFLRAYAEYLGLDGQLFLDEFNSRHHDARTPQEQPIASQPRSRPHQRRQRRESNLVMIVLAAIVAVSALVLLATTFPNATAPYPNTTTPGGGSSTPTTTTTTSGDHSPTREEAHLAGAPAPERRPRPIVEHVRAGHDAHPERPGRTHVEGYRPGAGAPRRPGADRVVAGAVHRSGADLPAARQPGRGDADHQRQDGVAAGQGAIERPDPDHVRRRHQGLNRPAAAILLTGNELLRGVISDQNGAHLAASLERHGFAVRRTLVVGDALEDIERGLRELIDEADLVVSSGGLGPTHDDRTVEALAHVAGVDLVLDADVLDRIDRWTDQVAVRYGLNRAGFDAGNRKQAHVPVGGHRARNGRDGARPHPARR